MRKVLVSEMVTLDGFFAGPNGEIDWHNVDAEFNDLSIEQLNSVDTLLFGRVTYQFMASYWPTSAALSDDPIVAAKMNALAKIVFSHTLETADWHNTRLVKGDLADEITRLKHQHGKDMIIFGSGALVSALAELDLVDEYRLFVNPVVIGHGQPLFQGLPRPLHLKLLATRQFRSGNVLLTYAPERGA